MKKFLSLFLMLVFALTLVACKDKEPQFDAKVEGAMTHAEFIAAAQDSPVVIDAYVQGKQMYAEKYGNTSLYLADKDGGYFVYRWTCTAEEYAAIELGQRVKVTGTKAVWSGEIEITEARVEKLEGINYVAKHLDVTSLLGTDELEAKQNLPVAFKGVKVVASKNGNEDVAFLYKYNGTGAEGDDLYFNVESNGQVYTFLVESDLCGVDTDVYKAVKALKIGDTLDLEGFLYWYNGVQPHINKVTVK